MKINKIEDFIPLSDLEFIEQYNPRIACVNNVWGMTNDYLHAVEWRMKQAKKELQTLLRKSSFLKKLMMVAQKEGGICRLEYGRVINWRTGKLEPLTIRAQTLEELKAKISKELSEIDLYLSLLEVLINEDAKAYADRI